MRLACALVLVGGIAHAGPVKPPIGWTTDPRAAVSLSNKAAEVQHFGGLPTNPTTEVYRAPSGGALFVTRIYAAVDKPADRDRAVTVELGELEATARRAGSAAVVEAGGPPRVIPDLKLLESRRSWRDDTTNVRTTARMIVAADDKQAVAVTGECVLAGDAPADVVTACQAALVSLDPEIPVDTRVVLHLVGAVQPATPTPSPSTTAKPSGPTLGAGGERPALPPMAITPQKDEREPDRRPVYVGIGLVVLALIFWWNRKNREKLERAYEERADQGKPDGDADDLHAAASASTEDDTKEKKDKESASEASRKETLKQ